LIRVLRRVFLSLGFLLVGGAATAPLPGPLRIIGGPATGGCIAGAESLPDHGAGFQTIHLNRSAFYGAPSAIEGLEALASEASTAGLPPLLVEDISRPRGGPLPGGHVSHQIGLDADVGLDMRPRSMLDASTRETVELASMVTPDGMGVVPGVWGPKVVQLLHMASDLPGIMRVLVNPAIKKQLCIEVTGDRSWLRRIRPWYGHAAHMHISFQCPPGQEACSQGPVPPAGDGCDATLQWWFDQLKAPKKEGPAVPYKAPVAPAACREILSGK
jgi:penicillin-insensitive murein DD-endopeptidase